MIHVFAIACLAAVYILRRHVRGLTPTRAGTFAGQLARQALTLLVSVSIAAGVLAAASLMHTAVDDPATSLSVQYRMESFLNGTLAIASAIKPGFWPSVVLLAALFLMAAAGVLQAGGRSRPGALRTMAASGSKFLGRYAKWVGTVVGTLTIVCSFTFLAPALEPGLYELSIRIRTTEEKLAELGAKASATVAEAYQQELLQEVIDSAPPAVRSSVTETQTRRATEEALVRRANEVREQFLIELPELRRFEATHRSSRAAVERAVETAASAERGTGQRGIWQAGNALETPASTIRPEEVTARRVDQAIETLDLVRESGHRRAAAILALDERRKVTGKIIGQLFKAGNTELIHALGVEFPFSKAILGVFENALSKAAERQIERRVFEPLAKSLAREAVVNPSGAESRLVGQMQQQVRQENVGEIWKAATASDPGIPGQVEADVAANAKVVDNLSEVVASRARIAERALMAEKEAHLRSLRRSMQRIVEVLPTRLSAVQSRLLLPGLTRSANAEWVYREPVETFFGELLKACENAPLTRANVSELAGVAAQVRAHEPVPEVSFLSAEARMQGLEWRRPGRVRVGQLLTVIEGIATARGVHMPQFESPAEIVAPWMRERSPMDPLSRLRRPGYDPYTPRSRPRPLPRR